MEALTYKNHSIKIIPDEYPENPREFDPISDMITLHRRYSIGDDHDLRVEDFEEWGEVENHLMKKYNTDVILPIYMYDHSGITIATEPFDCVWDSGQIGFIVLNRNKARASRGYKRITKAIKPKLFKIMDEEVQIYDQYLRGCIYGFEITGDDVSEEDSSCWGFYGEDDTLAAAKDLIDVYVTKPS